MKIVQFSMVRQLLLLFTLAIFYMSCGNKQTRAVPLKLTGNIKNDIINLIPKGNHTVDIMDGVYQNPRQTELSQKLQQGIKNNQRWFIEYMKAVPEGQPMPYHTNLGLTKEEYKELTGFMDDIELISTGREEIKVTQKGDTILFESRGKLSILNSLGIDTKSNTAIIGEYTMLYRDSVDVKDNKNGLKSKWKGYVWEFVVPIDFNSDDLEDLGNLKMKQYKLTIGQLNKNGKTYMSLKGREMEDGAKTVDFELPIIF